MGFMFWIWLIVMVVAVIVEISTTELTSLWFAIGAFCSLITNLFLQDNGIGIQITIFAVISIVSIVVFKPIIRRKMQVPKVATNVDALIGRMAVVTSTIEVNHPGTVKAEGIEWTANTENQKFEPGELVVIASISGNTLLVKNK